MRKSKRILGIVLVVILFMTSCLLDLRTDITFKNDTGADVTVTCYQFEDDPVFIVPAHGSKTKSFNARDTSSLVLQEEGTYFQTIGGQKAGEIIPVGVSNKVTLKPNVAYVVLHNNSGYTITSASIYGVTLLNTETSGQEIPNGKTATVMLSDVVSYNTDARQLECMIGGMNNYSTAIITAPSYGKTLTLNLTSKTEVGYLYN